MRGSPPLALAARKAAGENRAGPVGAVGGGDRAAHGFDETAADGEPEAGADALPVAAVDAIELVENLLESAGGMPSPSSAIAIATLSALAPRADGDLGPGWRIFRGIVE